MSVRVWRVKPLDKRIEDVLTSIRRTCRLLEAVGREDLMGELDQQGDGIMGRQRIIEGVHQLFGMSRSLLRYMEIGNVVGRGYELVRREP